ncbi:MAG: restriction endonuclease PLD domain-containing protein, partial [Ruoffia tabacinasalis]
MTERLLHDYPSLNITLYIGMTTQHEGLSKKDHEGFLNLTNQYGERIKIMYQITQPPTHIKLYSWIKDGSYYTHFVGSANFSENGLFKLNELMVESQQNFESLYLEQNKNSVPCTHPDIQKLITLY